ncbi:RecQ family ATP-dependent DNA helicase [Flavisolibacter ginsenosidimutans]|uniref:ATP-dependent DNA helicase RecQ n=1 Tax=Flavisolibacter ginsenosidimutans TaxID=661481 RepID=A0A5B8UJZ9_9BACT|nr:ATP-dependent DNA helicase RecQ [Flavisolibacter ginsenosidimutans]QEC57031.1 RecQ family ATP-dependent DNA helicase [Flavisolibacter ginsenosidimutans]
MADLLSILSRYWGYEAFRPQQEEIIQSVLDGKDTLALLPTGGGKSICYQVPALAQEGICLVVSPLIALMKDQVEALKSRGVGALMIYSGMTRKDVLRTLENARQDYFKFLYVSPERLETSLFKEYLPALNVNLIAVDEAHCISQWGYDFRPSYLKIAALREELPNIPVLAVTASATEAVQKDICDKLHFRHTKIFRQSFERKNLSYSVFNAEAKATKLVDVLKKVDGPAIVYCKTRKRTKEIASLLQMHGMSADFYHAGLSSEERSSRQQEWIGNKTRIIVCTNAFGMGIDKPDVRIVVHTDPPDCLENYYQEAGRCGRDGKKAYAVLLYDEKNIEELEGLHLLRYPSFETIKTVYEAVVNFLQIHVNEGGDRSYTFRFDDFVRNFKLNVHQVLYALQALESDGWLSYNEKAFTPSTLCFTASKERLYEFYQNHPEYESTLTTLLRTYEGIFDFPVFISETLLAKLLREEEGAVKENLQKISAYGIVRYTPQNDAPQLMFLKNRVATNDLRINLAAYNSRKEVFVARVQKMIQYIRSSSCRSRFTGHYFGDAEANDCGVCDNCLQKKKSLLTTEEFERITSAILGLLGQNAFSIADLIGELKTFRTEKVWEVLRFLQAENKIHTSAGGSLFLNGKTTA